VQRIYRVSEVRLIKAWRIAEADNAALDAMINVAVLTA
jgi:hypothetical protein